MHIKICGTTNSNDALQAVQAGATHLGMIFVEASPRCVTGQEAQKIAAAVQKQAIVVGVFQNQSLEAIAEIAVMTQIDAVQLHGSEDPAFCRSIALRLGKPVIKTIILAEGNQTTAKPTQAELIETIAAYSSCPDQVTYLLFDRAKGQIGEEWLPNALAQVSALEKQKDFLLPPYFFAGGLTPENLKGVLTRINPFGLDVASGVESSPGQKNPDLVRAFITAAKSEIAPSVY
jgi:phosphoribosylanthranilate isomerase